jgi:hypothetical protein
MTLEGVPDARRCQLDAQDGELRLDPAIAPRRVLPCTEGSEPPTSLSLRGYLGDRKASGRSICDGPTHDANGAR